MKTQKFTFILFFIICSFCSALAQKQVAVYVSGNQEEEIKKVLGQKVVTYITKSEDYQAKERTRDFLNALRSEQDFIASGDISLSQIVSLGEHFGADYVAAVDVSKVFDELFVAARLIDVTTETVKESYESSGEVNTMQALTKLANDIADGLIFASKREEQEAKEAEQRMLLAEQKKKEEQEELKRLRELAIRNLTPPGCKISGRLMYMSTLITGDLVVYGNQLAININLPYGFSMANLQELTELFNNGVLGLGYPILYNKRIREIRTSGGERDWMVDCFSGGRCLEYKAAHTVWNKKLKKLQIKNSRSLYVLAIKDAPSESQIQAEIYKLRYNR